MLIWGKPIKLLDSRGELDPLAAAGGQQTSKEKDAGNAQAGAEPALVCADIGYYESAIGSALAFQGWEEMRAREVIRRLRTFENELGYDEENWG